MNPNRISGSRTLTLDPTSWEEVAATGPHGESGQVTLTDQENPRPLKASYRITISKPCKAIRTNPPTSRFFRLAAEEP